MSMRISGTNATAASQGTVSPQFQQRQQTFKSLLSSLQAGDLNGAKTAYNSLTGGETPSGTSPMAQLGHALQSGDLVRAQQVARQMQTGASGSVAKTGATAAASTSTSTSTSASSSNSSGSDSSSGSGLLSVAAAVATGGATAIRGSLLNLLV